MQSSIAVVVLNLAMATTLVACSGTSSVTAGPAAPVPVPIDGTYGGTLQLSRGDAINCGNSDPITLQVVNHAFTYRFNQPQTEWRPVIVFNVTITPAGSFNVQLGPDSMSGRITGGTMQGQIIGDTCAFAFVADRGGSL